MVLERKFARYCAYLFETLQVLEDVDFRYRKKKMIHVFIVASKGIPAKYGGFETFVENLTARKRSGEIYYHVSCMGEPEKHFEYNNADCFNVKVPLLGAPGRIFHVSRVLSQVEKWTVKNKKSGATVIVYILGCRIGPLLIPHAKKLHKLGVKVFCNPDGLEWKRSKWSALEKKFLKYCEKCLVTNSDLAICDSVNIEKYIKKTYGSKAPRTTFIAYGADIKESECPEEKLNEWYKKFDIKPEQYYLIVGRFVPDNNYQTMIFEFVKSKTDKDLVIITNVKKNKFYTDLEVKTHFEDDKRIKFVGTVYDQKLLKKIRENAFAYIHGHEVGGTNPSLLEALASTKLNLLYEIGFNKEVGKGAALYWTKDESNLAKLIERADCEYAADDVRENMHQAGMKRVEDAYSWDYIVDEYEKIFLNEVTR